MFEAYFHDWNVRPEFEKKFVCIFDGWLGKEKLHRLDEVTEAEWSRLNDFVRLLQQKHRLYAADLEARVCTEVDDIESILVSFEEDAFKSSLEFTKVVIPELGAVYTEEDDYTWILWHKNNGAIEALSPLIKRAGLFHWSDASEQTQN